MAHDLSALTSVHGMRHRALHMHFTRMAIGYSDRKNQLKIEFCLTRGHMNTGCTGMSKVVRMEPATLDLFLTGHKILDKFLLNNRMQVLHCSRWPPLLGISVGMQQDRPTEKVQGEVYKRISVYWWVILNTLIYSSPLTCLISHHPLPMMTSFESDSGRQFETDPITGQVFYCEPIDGSYSLWTHLEPLDYHLSQLATHNVSIHLSVSPVY